MPYFGVPIRNGLPIGLGTLTALAKAVAVVVPPVSSDPYFEYVSLLLNTTSTNGAQNNTFLDGSTNAFSITRNGNTTQGTFSPFSQTGWSNYFDGTGDDLQLTNAAALSPGTGDFTFECWAYPQGSIANVNFFTGFQSGLSVGTDASGNLIYGDAYVANVIITTTPLPVNTWSHIAVARSGTTNSLYLNGTRIGTATSSADLTTGTANYIGSNGNTAGRIYYTGYISNLRLVKGSAVYDPTLTTLTVPTSPLTAITNTSLLTCQSNRFIDNSSNAFAITRNGDVSVQAFSPFNPTTAWSAGTNGGSGYFDGTGDSLSLSGNSAFSIATSTTPFTIEGWVYISAAGGCLFSEQFTGASNSVSIVVSLCDGVGVENTTGRFIGFGWFNGTAWTSAAISTTEVALNTWTHVACVFTGSTTKIYLNGVDSTKSSSPTPATTWGVTGVNGDSWFIGRRWSSTATEFLTGYISNLRFVNGTGVYTAAFTPPTAPLTAITNTSLLLNFTNAGIFDSASGNDLETVGNAQVSTAVAKWGTTSLAFDGTGDSLTAIDRPALRFGTAPFTIEGWVYLNVINASQGIASKRNATPTGWLLQVSSSNKLQLTFDASTLASTGSLAASTWYHFALVREGTGTNQTKLYINGVNDGAGTVANNFNQTDALAVGSDRGSGSYLNGYIDDLRITNGYARYTANFTPPTAAFPLN